MECCDGLSVTIVGTEGDDHICGGGGNDTIYGENVIFTGLAGTLGTSDCKEGSDLIIGDYGKYDEVTNVSIAFGTDYIKGGMSDDIIAGVGLDITLTTSAIFGTTNNILKGGEGNDIIYGQFTNGTYHLGLITLKTGYTLIDADPGVDTCTNVELVVNYEM